MDVMLQKRKDGVYSLLGNASKGAFLCIFTVALLLFLALWGALTQYGQLPNTAGQSSNLK